MRPFSGEFEPPFPIQDRELVQLICALRIFNPQIELSISTRESVALRDNLLPMGITTMSAYSSTQPGGYANLSPALEQFEISDHRRPEEVAAAIRSRGFEAVWKDWTQLHDGAG